MPQQGSRATNLQRAEFIRVSSEDLHGLVARLFVASGLAEDAASRVAAGLVESDLEGVASHGVMLVNMYVERIRRGSVSTNASTQLISDRAAAVVLDAGDALGQLTGEQAMALAVERAKRFGVGIQQFAMPLTSGPRAIMPRVAGSRMHRHRDVQYASTDAGAGGAERVVGNNPIAIAVPVAGPIPIVLDMATSEAAMGKIRMAGEYHRPIPANWAVTSEGSSTTDEARLSPACCAVRRLQGLRARFRH